MISERIKYNRSVLAKAGIKRIHQAGLEVHGYRDLVILYSVNRKDDNITTNLSLSIPREQVQDLINLLNTMK